MYLKMLLRLILEFLKDDVLPHIQIKNMKVSSFFFCLFVFLIFQSSHQMHGVR